VQREREQDSVEDPWRYLLLVEWEALEDHSIGFRGSAAYERWQSLLHHFYDPFPVVEHYEAVFSQ
jgi:heme-degrading monooxygenase HmoA